MVEDQTDSATKLLLDDGQGYRPSLERFVAFQWRPDLDSLGARTARMRDATLLSWMAEATAELPGPHSILDIGCAFGNHLLMAHAYLGKPSDLELVGVDLNDESLQYGRAFARSVPGYENCHFEVGDVESGLRFDDEHFSVVNLADVLEHLEDPKGCFMEVHRLTRRGGLVLISTPQPYSWPKRASKVVNRFSGGRIAKSYYAGKGATLDEHGNPIMEVAAGHEHISEMELRELIALARATGFRVAEVRPMTVISGSAWFDRHPILLAAVLALEAAHVRLRRPSWAHGLCLRLVRL